MTETKTETKQTQSSASLDSYVTRKEQFALVRGKYRVYSGLPVPMLDMPNAKAFQAEDVTAPDHKIFALVCKPDLPIRKDHIKARNGLKVDGLLPLVDAGTAFWQPISRKTMILLYEMPLGGRVVQSKTYGKILPEEEAEKISKWVRPLLVGISNLAVRGLTHRAIRPDNLFYMDAEKTKVVWGDCIAAPPGYDQPSAFETIETSMCQAAGKGNGTTADDLYAFGATLICLGIGYNPVESLSDTELLELKIYKGSYAALIGEERVPLALIELFRGLLADNINQRWDISSTQLWADGRRLTPVQAKTVRTSQRPFLFNNVEFFTYRTLAYAFAKNWDMAADVIRSEKLLAWIEHGFDDKETADAIRKSIDMALVRFSTKEKQDDFFVARTCMLLDPSAPLRIRNCAFLPDALGTMLAINVNDDKKTKMLIGLIATGYLESWYEFHQDMVSEQNIKNMQITLQKPGKGMGIERLLYDLNEGLPCQSPLVVKDYVDEARDLLPALEEVAKKANPKTEPIDRHIAAFIAVRFGSKVLEQISWLNSPKENVAIQGMLNIFAALQRTFGPDHLYAMCSWIGGMVVPVIDSYHNLEKRQQLEKNLPKIIRKGNFSELCAFLDDRQERLYDLSYFEQAKKEYARLSEEIEFLDGNREKREQEGLMLGNQVAAVVSFGIAVLTMFLLLITRLLRG
ncbi:MAG: hypothetical protein IJ752_06625 [Alphaproteobacteria bacterium]|nr:hypothetical protein [Alphaproteobacteria bacterium]